MKSMFVRSWLARGGEKDFGSEDVASWSLLVLTFSSVYCGPNDTANPKGREAAGDGSTTPVRGTATSANDAPIAPRRGRPTKPTEKIREAQVNLGLRTDRHKGGDTARHLTGHHRCTGERPTKRPWAALPTCPRGRWREPTTQNTEPQGLFVEETQGIQSSHPSSERRAQGSSEG